MVSFLLGKVRALQVMGYSHPLWLPCWRQARAADPPSPHQLQGSEARAENLLTVAAANPNTSSPPPCLRVECKGDKAASFPEQGGSSRSLLPGSQPWGQG